MKKRTIFYLLFVLGLIMNQPLLSSSRAQTSNFQALPDMVDRQVRTVLPNGLSRRGTGFSVSAGLYLTSAHNVLGCNVMQLTALDDPKKHDAKLLGVDTRIDAALLAAPSLSLRPLKIEQSSERIDGASWEAGVDVHIETGRKYVRSGGQVRSGDRYLYRYGPALEIGSSGAPVVNDAGNVIGMMVGRWNKKEGAESLAVQGHDLIQFLYYLGVRSVEPVRRKRWFGGREAQNVSSFEEGLVNVFCDDQ